MSQERRKDFEKRAAFSENIFRTLFRIASVGIGVADTGERRLLDVNDKFCQITGYTREELIGMKTPDLTHPDDRAADEQKYSAAARSEGTQHLTEKRYLRKDGSVVWVRVNAAFMRDESGIPIRTMALVEDITARVEAEAALRKSQRQLQAFLDGMPDRAFLKDAQGRFIAANLSEARALGAASASELIGKTLADFRPPEHARRVDEEDREVIRSGRILRVERHPPDAPAAWYEIIKAPIRDETGQFAALVCLARDVTERRRMEDELRETDFRLREFLDGIPARAWFKDTQGRFLMMNSRQLEARGAGGNTLAGKTADEILPPEHAARIKAEDEQVILSGKTLRIERQTTLDGAWAEIVKAPVRRRDGSIIGMVGVSRDISDRKRAEQALRDSEGKLRALLDALPDRAWLKDAQGHYVAVNRSFAQAFDLTPEDIAGKTHHDLFPPDVAAQIEAEENAVKAAPEATRTERQFLPYRRWFETIKTPICAPDGTVAGLVAIARDITERKQAEDDLRAAKAAAEEANRAKGEFLSHMSHEMRTPMNAILGFAELALLEQPDTSQVEHLTKITVATKSLLRVIDDVLDFERVDAGKLQLESIDFRLGDVLQNVRDMVERTANTKGLALRFKVGDDVPPRLKGDPSRIAQVLMNLCANAVKFTSNGYVEVVARTGKVSDAGVTLHIEVRDTGIGMTDEERAKLFQPFTQADSSTTRRYGGTGLGLVICKRLVELMGGRIWIDSQPGEGTTVSFTLVCAPSGQPVAAQAALREQLPAEAAALAGKRVLVVDDHPINRMLMAKLLKLAGADAVPAENGLDALRVLEQEPNMDLVLMDLRMPEMDGYEATRRIRADQRWGKLPIVAVTASAATYERARCMAAGMNDIMVKPIHQAVFFPVIAAVMKQRDEALSSSHAV